MNTVHRVILVGFVGATLWVLTPLLAVHMGVEAVDLAGTTTLGKTGNPFDDELLEARYGRAWKLLLMRTVQSEITIVTVAGCAWILAAMLKDRSLTGSEAPRA
jgi:hypothetical protein